MVNSRSEEGFGDLSSECRGWEIQDREGEKIGKVEEVFVDGNDRPEYLGIKAGLLGGKLNLIPVDIARAADEKKVIEISESRDRIKDAPSLGSNEEITARRERGIREHFGLDSSSPADNVPREGDTSEIPLSHRNGPESQDKRASNFPDASDHPPIESGENEDKASRSVSNPSEGTSESSVTSGVADPARQDRGGEPGGRETMRVNVWREKARAALVLGDDGSEEVRIRREWVEEEEIVEVEDRR